MYIFKHHPDDLIMNLETVAHAIGSSLARTFKDARPDWPTLMKQDGVKASSVSLGDGVLRAYPTAKRLINWPIDALMDTVNGALNTYPNGGVAFNALGDSLRQFGRGDQPV